MNLYVCVWGYGSGCGHGWVLEVNGTIILHTILSYPQARSKRIIVCFFVCATMAGAREMIRLCTNSSHMPLLLRHRTPGLPAVMGPGPSQASVLTATLKIFPFFPPRCSQDLEWLVSYQHILKLHYPKLEASEDCLYLNIYAPAHADNGSNLPVRLPAMRGAPASRFSARDPGGVAGCLESNLPPVG